MNLRDEFQREFNKLTELRKLADAAWSDYCILQQTIRGQENAVRDVFNKLCNTKR